MHTTLIAILTALTLDFILGDPPNRFHPVAAMGNLIRRISNAAPQTGRVRCFLWGLGLMIPGVVIFVLPWFFIVFLINQLPFWLAGMLLGFLLKPVLALRRLFEAGKEVHTALAGGNLPEARRLVSWHLVSRDTSVLSAGQVSSATVESLAENLTDSFFAPLLAFALGGLPLAWFYRFANTADAMIGYRTPRLEYLGKFAARLDDVLNWLPARLSAFFLIAAALLCRLDAVNAWRTMARQHSRTDSPNAGWTMAAAAGALGVRLEKVNTYILDGGSKLPEVEDIPRAVCLVRSAAGLGIIFCGVLVYVFTVLF